ncbi:thermonuclease family protein [Cellulomonas sp. Root137]|uniref:thermonuclease family protein n=1 Tax=Cellulomonas sp. Root137 TaxID=1736459 RepID=UPI000AC2D973|nr:thermonuclease family protein [Cellulomonas sp. Root137]
MKFLAALVLSCALVLAGAVPATASERSRGGETVDRTVRVVRVVDGDTIVVRDADGVYRVRLLNIDTPETVDPRSGVECLGPEASAFLHDRLPAGTSVQLEHDRIKHDRYGRELAAVYVGSALVNAEIARAGLADALVIGGNDAFYGRVLAAQKEARTAARGLYDESTPCTVPAQVAAVEQSAATLLAQPPAAGAGVESFDAYAGQLAAATTAAAAVTAVLATDLRDRHLLGLNAGRVRTLSTRVAAVQTSLDVRAGETVTGRASEVARIAAEQAAAAQAEAERVAAAAQAEAARAAKAAARKRTPAAPAPAPAAPAAPAPAAPAAPAVDNYTGCRAYGSGGTSVDKKGQRYTKIDCVTKAPLG